MKIKFLCRRAVFSLALSILAANVGEAQETVFHADVRLVTLTFSVLDEAGKSVPGLTKGNFKLREDGIEQKVSTFASESQLPLKIGLLIDVSDSQQKFLKRHVQDTEVFLREILRPQDQVFALCFGNHLRVASDLTSSPLQIVDDLEHFGKNMETLPELAPDSTREGGTALYDAVYASVQEKLAASPGYRRVLILFTDGEENSSSHDEVEAIAAAQGADTLIYAIRYTEVHHGKPSAGNRHGMAALHHLSSQSGGVDFDGLHTDLPETFRQIAAELRSQYSITYYSTNKTTDGSFRKVALEPLQTGLMVRARAGYYSSPSTR